MVTIDCGGIIKVVDDTAELEVEVVEVFSPKPPVTPPGVVGIVTDATGGTAAELARAVVLAAVVVAFEVVFSTDGHRAATIPPFITIPNSVFDFTLTFEQESDTLFATEFSAETQAAEHPLLKSVTSQVGIWLSYVTWQVKGIDDEVML